MSRIVRWSDIIPINIYWFALTTRAQTISPLIIPILVQQFVGEEFKGSAVGQIRLWALMTAVLVQALAGVLSDRSTGKLGRRRPFILAGTLGELIVFALIGLSAGLSSESGYRVLFGLYILSMLFSNTAHAATAALIPDLVSDSMRGRYSGVKALFELPLPLIFVSVVMGRLVSQGKIWAALLVLMAVLLVCAVIAMFIPEQRQLKSPYALDWSPFVRLVLMTAAFTAVILGMGAFVRWFMSLPLIPTPGLNTILTVTVGLVAMTIAVGAGVIISLRIGVGKDLGPLAGFKWWVVNRLAFLVGTTNVGTFLLFFLQEKFAGLQGEKAAAPAAIIALIVGLSILLTALPGGWMADRFGKKILITAAGLLAAVGMAVILLSNQLMGIYAGGSIVGIGTGLFYAANWALGTELVPEGQAGRFLGLSNLAGAGAGAIGAYIGGPIADGIGFTPVMGIYTILFLISIAAISRVKETRKLA